MQAPWKGSIPFESTMKNLIFQAIDLANRAHDGQVRKYTAMPYIMHPARVAGALTQYTNDQEQIAAAWLHDVLEDATSVFRGELFRVMPTRVIELVQELTNKSKDMVAPRSVRKFVDREALASASPEARRIKLLDRIDNLAEMTAAPADFRGLYATESQQLLEALRGTSPELEQLLLDTINAVWEEADS